MAAAEVLARHAVAAGEVTAIGDADAEVEQRARSSIEQLSRFWRVRRAFLELGFHGFVRTSVERSPTVRRRQGFW